MTNERAVQALERLTTIPGDGFTFNEISEAMRMGANALRAQQEQPNEPLTLEELREMDGEKIHIRYIGHCKNFYEDETVPYYGKNEQYIQHYNGMLRACDLPLQYYGEDWLAYRRKPEQEE